MKLKKETIIISGGGTGGHIYPGVAIARAIQRLSPQAEVHFVGAQGGLEEKIVPKENFPLHLLQIGKLHASVGRKQQLVTLLKLPFAFIKCLSLLRKIKPTAVLGVGGYASGPMLFVASLMGYKTFIWEPNAHPGLANRMLSRFVKASLVVFDAAKKDLKSAVKMKVGLPVRTAFEQVQLKPQSEPMNILIFGGSQGARAINEAVITLLEKKPAWLNQVQIVHQTGPTDFKSVNARYEKLKAEWAAERGSDLSTAVPSDLPSRLTCLEYIHDMPQRMEWANLVIARSGASTVAEIAAAQKAALFIPLPTAADDHQRKNADALAEKGACEVLLQIDLTPDRLSKSIETFLNHRDRLNQFETRVKEFHVQRADEQIANILLQNP